MPNNQREIMTPTSSHPAFLIAPQGSQSLWSRLRLAGVALLLLLTFPVAAYSATGTTSDGWEWASDAGVVTITGYSGAGGAVSIPGTVNVSGTNLVGHGLQFSSQLAKANSIQCPP